MKHCLHMKRDPKWEITKPCVQDHEHTVNNYYYTTTVSNVTPFNVPRVGQEITVGLDKVISVLGGAVLWNPSIGQLLIKSFNKDDSTVVLTAYDTSVDYGKAVLSNTEFLVGIPKEGKQGSEDYLNAPYLAADFISPGNGECQEASVTTIAGLSIGNKVSIAGYVYRIGALVNKETLRLCNYGEGAEKGVVIAFDPRDCGEPSVPVVVYETSPCEAIPVQTGQIVVCKDKALTTIQGEADGQMIRWNNNHKRWELVNAYLAEDCTFLTACLTIDIIEDEDFLATVKSTAIFNKDNKIIIEDKKFIITEIINDTQMRIKPEETFSVITTYNPGTNVCLEPCCAWVPAALEDTVFSEEWRPISLRDYILNWAITKKLENKSGSTELSDISAGGNKTISGGNFDIVDLVNPSKYYSLILHARFHTYINGVLPSGSELLISTQMHNVIQVQYGNETSPTDYSQDTFDVIYVPSSNTHSRPKGYYLCQEREIIIPPYNEDEPEKSTVTIKCSFKFSNLSSSNSAFTFGNNDPERNYMEARLYITGNFNNVSAS